MRLIDADDLIEDLKHFAPERFNSLVENIIRNQPTIEVNQGGDLISRQNAINAICNQCSIGREEKCEDDFCPDVRALRELSAIDIDLSKYSDKLGQSAYERGKAERKRGEWIEVNVKGMDYVYCSECECYYPVPIDPSWNYCPNCGADMRGGC